MDLVWQALARAKSAALQVARHLDCRQGLPADALEPPSSYAPVSGSGVDAATDVHEVVHAMAERVYPPVVDVVIESVAVTGAGTVTPPASSERAAEGLPHDASHTPKVPSPLKSVLRPPEGVKREESVTFSPGTAFYQRTRTNHMKPGIQPSISMVERWRRQPLIDDANELLDFTMGQLPCRSASVEAFTTRVDPDVFMLRTSVDYWRDDSLSSERRLTVLKQARSNLQDLTLLTQDFRESVRSGQAVDITGLYADRLLETLEDKLIDLGFAQARLQAHIEEQESLQRAEIENARIAHMGLSRSEETAVEIDEDSDAAVGLDFEELDTFAYGDTAGVVRRLRDPMCARLGRIFDLERQIGEPGQTRVEQLRSVEGLVEDLGQLDKLLSRHLAQYTGKNHDFKVWMDQKITEVRLTFQDWDRALSRIRAQ